MRKKYVYMKKIYIYTRKNSIKNNSKDCITLIIIILTHVREKILKKKRKDFLVKDNFDIKMANFWPYYNK